MKKIPLYRAIGVVVANVAFFGAMTALPVHAQSAQGVTILPAVIDGTGVTNDILNYTLTITNTSGKQENIFATVGELTPSGTQVFANPSMEDRATLLADWLSVSRGSILLHPGESTTTPVQVQISPYAVAGDYHAVVLLVQGDTRDEAEHDLIGAPQALINISVTSDLVASLRVDSFSSGKSFYTSFPVTFNYTVENTGQVSSAPSGQVMFYDRSGHELGSVDANPNGLIIAPGQKQSFTAEWQNGGELGQYKAVLDLTYGSGSDRLDNTALVWVLPWKKILAIFAMLFILTIIVALLLHREYAKRHHRRQRAIENLLKRKPAEPTRETTIDLRRHE